MTGDDLLTERAAYLRSQLRRDEVAEDPVRQLRGWLGDAAAADVREPNAMVLSTVDADGMPDARVVLLRDLGDGGLVFHSNRRSEKGRQLAANPGASALFFWPELERQVRVRGSVALLDDAASDVYFASRPRGSQIGAWASPQSEPLLDREQLDELVAEVTARFARGDVPRPPHWGGFVLVPRTIEFWQGRTSRLHDRFRHTRTDAGWTVARLAP